MKLSEFKKLEKERTPGEWTTSTDTYPNMGGNISVFCVNEPRVRIDEACEKAYPELNKMATIDTNFIAACSTMVPRLLAVVEAIKSIKFYGDGDFITCSGCELQAVYDALEELEEGKLSTE